MISECVYICCSRLKLRPDGRYQEFGQNLHLKIHPSSVLFGAKPPFILFNELQETNQIYARNILAGIQIQTLNRKLYVIKFLIYLMCIILNELWPILYGRGNIMWTICQMKQKHPSWKENFWSEKIILKREKCRLLLPDKIFYLKFLDLRVRVNR